MIDKVLNVASVFDWITPLMAFGQDFLFGPASDFGISPDMDWRRREIKRLLKREGIHVWGLMLNLRGDMLMFTVSRNQAQRVYDLLQQEGVPLLQAPAEVIHPTFLQASSPPSS